MTSFSVYFVRHGQTYLNKYHRIQGWVDAPLTDKGIADAKHAGDRLKVIPFDAAYTSDAPRAQNTAKYILAVNPGTVSEATIDTAFREESFGYFEGNDDLQAWHMIGGPDGYDTFSKMIAGYSIETVKDMIAAKDPYHDAEDNAQFWARLDAGFNRLIATHHDGDKVLVASHGTTIRSIVSRYSDTLDPSETTENGSVTKFTITDGHIHVDYFNNTSDAL
ncbi:fructose-2,6-bisphosphatase [Secundilactobacillus paracollinoides]|uniref:histidine phosphatase family protein n=1 Tax=Secundilactobacillus paracollinoides TaxID=240427 RepID=UPI00081A80AD|nr:histidine phosphatase family protein [Secundilactobacillus paracollinoides]ANZ64202.1 fructose-2,6-bisphosphatase [Secundilactobacillus paracollinoides]